MKKTVKVISVDSTGKSTSMSLLISSKWEWACKGFLTLLKWKNFSFLKKEGETGEGVKLDCPPHLLNEIMAMGNSIIVLNPEDFTISPKSDLYLTGTVALNLLILSDHKGLLFAALSENDGISFEDTEGRKYKVVDSGCGTFEVKVIAESAATESENRTSEESADRRTKSAQLRHTPAWKRPKYLLRADEKRRYRKTGKTPTTGKLIPYRIRHSESLAARIKYTC